MSLTANDFKELRVIIREEVDSTVESRVRNVIRDEVRSALSIELEPIRADISEIKGRLTALENDIKEIYGMISDLQNSMITDPMFKKRSVEEKLLTLNAELIATAKQAGVTLPR